MKAIMVTTKHKGVFFGYVPSGQDMHAESMRLENARMCGYWSTAMDGVAGLAEKGPDGECKIGATATIESLRDITAVWAVAPEAEEKWKVATWDGEPDEGELGESNTFDVDAFDADMP